MRVYCDSVILIYYLEGAPPFKARATARLQFQDPRFAAPGRRGGVQLRPLSDQRRPAIGLYGYSRRSAPMNGVTGRPLCAIPFLDRPAVCNSSMSTSSAQKVWLNWRPIGIIQARASESTGWSG